MPEPRYRQVSIEDTPYYHCVSRCVRRAFLCGSDPLTGFNFEHRRQWIVDRIKLLCSVFAVDLCAYAIMSNHYHIVVRINSTCVDEWTDEEVAHRWMQIFSGPLLMHQYLANADLTRAELKCVADLFATWRERLANLSWFMRCINEPIARMANSEVRLDMNASPVLKYLAKDDLHSSGALGPVSKLRAFAASVGRKFVKGHVLGDRLCPERA